VCAVEVRRTSDALEPCGKKKPGGILPGVVCRLASACIQCGLPRPALPAVTFSGFLFFFPFGRVLP